MGKTEGMLEERCHPAGLEVSRDFPRIRVREVWASRAATLMYVWMDGYLDRQTDGWMLIILLHYQNNGIIYQEHIPYFLC